MCLSIDLLLYSYNNLIANAKRSRYKSVAVSFRKPARNHHSLPSHHDYNLQEHEARMDELEGTLRGHIGLIEEALERIEGKKMDGKSQKM